jgi:hypothetical protein
MLLCPAESRTARDTSRNHDDGAHDLHAATANAITGVEQAQPYPGAAA